MTAFSARYWSDADTQKAIDMARAGYSSTQIGLALGRTRKAVNSRLKYVRVDLRTPHACRYRDREPKMEVGSRKDWGFDPAVARAFRAAEANGTLPRIYDGQDVILKRDHRRMPARPPSLHGGSQMADCVAAGE